MRKQKILSIFGTRPEALKIAPILQTLKQYPDAFDSLVCFTGQHRELVYPTLNLFQIKPDFSPDVMQANQNLTNLTSNLLLALEPIIQSSKPDWIIAQGDTTSVMVAALMAYYHQIRFAHVEAGLRTDDKYQPFPEEGNRLIADRLADLCFAPTPHAQARLLNEGIPSEKIYLTGNTIIDALETIMRDNPQSSLLNELDAKQRLVLITAHRRENFGKPMQAIFSAIQSLAQSFPDVLFVYPVHPNPNVRQMAYDTLVGFKNIRLIEPLEYREMLALMQRAEIILSDSGGLQEEAPSFGVPLLVLRETTERPEGVAAGVARLVGTDAKVIIETASHLLKDPQARAAMRAKNPYGDGKAAQRIAEILMQLGKSHAN